MKFAIVGAGAIGLEHIRNIQILDGSQVTAVADPVEKITKMGKTKFLNKNNNNNNNVQYVNDYKELFTMDNVDTLIICTPNYHHINVLRMP